MTTTDAGDSDRVPSRSVLDAADGENRASGHELGGFLSSSAGFLPERPTVTAFPPSHAAWDDIVDRMPELWRSVSLRDALRELPVLRAGAGELPDEYVWRASVALTIFAHAYVRVEKIPAGDVPASVLEPWAEVSERLHRRAPFMSYDDLVVYNHRIRDPSVPHPLVVENMDLLVPTVDGEDERRFYLPQVEILDRAAPLVSAVVRAQEAAVREERAALEDELLLMLQTWREIPELSFRKIDPNPLSATHVDQVVWANTVAPLAVPLRQDTAGPGGEASALFHLMDAFLGRKAWASYLGKEVKHVRAWLPPRQRSFLEAVRRVSVGDYLAASGDRALQSLFDTLLDAFAGKKGFLGIHRTKVYGFLELAFKVGRSVTITHIEGGFEDRQWERLDGVLEDAREERYRDVPPHAHHARVASREATAPSGEVTRIGLDVSESGVVYRPGDRCGVLAPNRDSSVDATLSALRASGDEPIPVTDAWRRALGHRPEVAGRPTTVALRTFLRYAKLRPLTRPMAKALQTVSVSPGLLEVIEAYREEHWELSDALNLITGEGYDVRRLLEAALWQPEALARIVPPEEFRMYSVASGPDAGTTRRSSRLELTVAQLRYPEDEERGPGGTRDERSGTASTFLSEARVGDPVPLRIVRPTHFTLPRDRSRPIVMFAGGVGIAPFLGFIAERSRDASTGENRLFFATKSTDHVHCRADLESAVGRGDLSIRVIFSREDAALVADPGGTLVRVPAPRGRIDSAIAEAPDIQEALWQLLRSEEEGGQGAFFYVCGRAGFAQSVMRALTAVAERFAATDGDAAADAKQVMRRLMAEGRYMQDVFAGWTPHPAPGVLGAGRYDTSEVALHTSPEAGQWLIVRGNVYDVTEFLHLHPGGPRIVVENVGLDATHEYEVVRHHENSEINAMLEMYKIGSIRRLALGDGWGIALLPRAGLSVVSLRDLYRSWVRFLHSLTAMSNALSNDWGYMKAALTRGDDPDELNALKVQFASNTHERFLSGYATAAVGDDVLDLWALTKGLCAPPDFDRSLRGAIEEARATPEAAATQRFSEQMRTLYRQVSGDPALVDDAVWTRLGALCAWLERQDRAFLAEIRSVIRDGVRVFEELEDRTMSEGGDRLIAVLDRIPDVLRTWHRSFVAGLEEVGPLPFAEPAGRD